MLEHAALAEVERGAGKALLQNGHHADEHLRADLRVELEELVQREALHLGEGLLHKGLYLTLLRRALLLVHRHLRGPAPHRHTVGRALSHGRTWRPRTRHRLLHGVAACDIF